MKYKEGNIVLLNNGKTVYIMSVDEEKQRYQVFETDNDQNVYYITDSKINMLLT